MEFTVVATSRPLALFLIGRAVPLGIGAGIGAVGNAVLARSAIAAAREAFGPAPTRFPPRVIDVHPVDGSA
jgi:hypothetical protein